MSNKFYVDQPVVCIWDRENWITPNILPDAPIPRKGGTYIVSGLMGHHAADPMLAAYVNLREYDQGWCFSENGFVPVTENRVKGIIEASQKMGPWTGGVHRKEKEPEDA